MRVALPMSWGGSPARRASSSGSRSRPVEAMTLETTSRTEAPWPVPTLKTCSAISWPPAR